MKMSLLLLLSACFHLVAYLVGSLLCKMHLRRDVRTSYNQNEPRQDLGHLSVQFSLH